MSTEQRFSFNNRLLLPWVYLALIITATVFGSSILTKQQEHHASQVSNGHLYYSSSVPTHKVMAENAQSAFGLKLHDLEDTSSWTHLKNLTGLSRIKSPTLVTGNEQKYQVVSGHSSVENILVFVSKSSSPYQRGRSASIITGAIVFLACLHGRQLVNLSSIAGIFGLVGLTAIYEGCLTCQTDKPYLITLAPIVGIAYLIISICIFSFGLSWSKYMILGLLVTSSLIPFIQLYLIALEPKLCIACLLFTTSSSLYLVASYYALSDSCLRIISLPKVIKYCFVLWIVFLSGRHGFTLQGSFNLPDSERELTILTGKPLHSFVSRHIDPSKQVVLVSKSSCKPCKVAADWFRQSDLPWVEVPVCTLIQNTECFSTKGISTITPMILVVDENQEIIFEQQGWHSSKEEQTELYGQLKTLLRRN